MREQSKTRQPREALVQDLPGVMIRGRSAAVVVFLAVKGGLAVFTTGETEPNPYVLFFTVLVGAALTGQVWQWARNRLGTTLPDDQG